MGSRSFLPGGLIQTAAQAQAAGRGMRSRTSSRRKRKANGARKTSKRARKASTTRGRKPRPGTKAWMTYIRGMRGKKRK